jgi:EAL domain-containing protein (putative c-di-GMP-specific phosphodiesterase class I)
MEQDESVGTRRAPFARRHGALATRPAAAWYLETEPVAAARRRIAVRPLPFRVGRDPGAELMVPSHAVSKLHAELYVSQGELHLRDLGSTNGTFVDFERIEDAVLSEGAVLHFADFECRLGRAHAPEPGLSTLVLPRRFATGRAHIHALLREEAIEAVFQPIVSLQGGATGMYEALARGRHPDLPEQPEELFWLAVSTGKEAALSRLCRQVAVERVAGHPELRMLFLNTHPSELREPGLIESLAVLRERAPHVELLLEIHESALADTQTLTGLRASLLEIGVGLVYDDFGAGQARLLELAEVPPDYLKFNIRFVRGIDAAPASKRRLLGSFLEAARDLRVRCVAEGVETQAEADACASLGFTHAQGYFFGRPNALGDRTSTEGGDCPRRGVNERA